MSNKRIKREMNRRKTWLARRKKSGPSRSSSFEALEAKRLLTAASWETGAYDQVDNVGTSTRGPALVTFDTLIVDAPGGDPAAHNEADLVGPGLNKVLVNAILYSEIITLPIYFGHWYPFNDFSLFQVNS